MTKSLSPLKQWPGADIEAVLDAAFGSDRHLRTAYRIRQRMTWLPDYSYAIADDTDKLLAVLQSWPVALHGDDGLMTPLIMVGPVAVLPAHQGEGLGRLMMDRLIADAEATAQEHLMMIGDPEYYGRFWGFHADDTGGWRTPGPVDSRRLLMRRTARLDPLPALDGMLGPRPA